jgi:hypothetical protein
MCLSFDGQYLICGDIQGLLYVWNIASPDFITGSSSNLTSPRNGQQKSELLSMGSSVLHTFELHKDKGPITNLLCIYRPLSLFGLTANMKAYEPIEAKPLQKYRSYHFKDW